LTNSSEEYLAKILVERDAYPNAELRVRLSATSLRASQRTRNWFAFFLNGVLVNLGVCMAATEISFRQAFISGDEELYRLSLNSGAIIDPSERDGSFVNSTGCRV
jgi:hypothetical protein